MEETGAKSPDDVTDMTDAALVIPAVSLKFRLNGKEIMAATD